MGGSYTGGYYGYRELDIVQSRTPGVRPQGSLSPMKLSPIVLDAMGLPGYDYTARNGDVPEDFATDWIDIPVPCRMATWTLRGGPVEIQTSYDGVTVGDVRVLRASTTTFESFVAYRIRQLVPGILTWYQLLAII